LEENNISEVAAIAPHLFKGKPSHSVDGINQVSLRELTIIF